jgi:hypothetical protein
MIWPARETAASSACQSWSSSKADALQQLVSQPSLTRTLAQTTISPRAVSLRLQHHFDAAASPVAESTRVSLDFSDRTLPSCKLSRFIIAGSDLG